jgi:nucleoside-diphosphate-sugar epimerase
MASAPASRALVTGASGFIGSHLCRALNRDGVEVHAISRASHPELYNGVRWRKGDLTDLETVRTVLTEVRPDTVFHLAGGHVWGGRDMDLALPILQNDLIGTVNLLIAATEIGVRRIVYTGSQEEPETSEGAPTPCSPYAAAKWAGSVYTRMFHALYGTPAVIARVFMVYGPGSPEAKLIPYVTGCLLNGEPPRLTTGDRPVDWIYVTDVVEGLRALARAPGVEGRTLDLGSGVLTPIRTVVEKLVAITGAPVEPRFGALPDRRMEQVRVADAAATRDAAGWAPAVSLDAGLEMTVEWRRRVHAARPSEPHASLRGDPIRAVGEAA